MLFGKVRELLSDVIHEAVGVRMAFIGGVRLAPRLLPLVGRESGKKGVCMGGDVVHLGQAKAVGQGGAWA